MGATLITSIARIASNHVLLISASSASGVKSASKTRSRFAVLAAVVVSLVFQAGSAFSLPGNVVTEQKISDTAGGFGGTLSDSDFFGAAVGSLGDLDNSGIPDIVVGANEDDDGGTSRGAAWVVFLDAAGQAVGEQKISDTAGGFTGTLDDSDEFGCAVAGLGDLDGDGVRDMAVGAIGDDDGGTDRGAVWVLFLDTDGTVKSHQKISSTSGGLGAGLADGDKFGTALAPAGDLDGNGVDDLIVGAPGADGGGTDRGAVWILFMNTDGTVASSALIDDGTAALSGKLDDFDGFGTAAAVFNDLDGDSVQDLVVGAPGDDDGAASTGAIYIMTLTTAGAVTAAQKISKLEGGFAGGVSGGDEFGSSLAITSNLNPNADGNDEIMVGAPGDEDAGGGTNRGQIWVLFVNPGLTVGMHRQIRPGLGGFTGPLADGDFFGSSVTAPRDIDGDGVADIVVGARRDDDGGSNRGAVYVLLLDGVPGAFCGDSVLDVSEDCDDGNNLNGDCCSASCNFEVAGSACADADICNGDETCDGAGTCTAGTPLDCDDGEPCSQDTCDPVGGCSSSVGPATACLLPERAKFELKDKATDKSDTIKWKWQKGEETFLADFGNPQSTTEYALCVYDESAGVPMLSTALQVPPSALWTSKSSGAKYKDKLAASDGVKAIALKAGAEGKAKVQLTAKGTAIPMPTPVGVDQNFAQDTRVIVQLVNSEGFCWSSEFTGPAARNNGEQFKDRTP